MFILGPSANILEQSKPWLAYYHSCRYNPKTDVKHPKNHCLKSVILIDRRNTVFFFCFFFHCVYFFDLSDGKLFKFSVCLNV